MRPAAAYGDVLGAIDNARLPFLPDSRFVTGGSDDGQGGGEDDEDGQDEGKPKKRGGRRAAVECVGQPKPRKLGCRVLGFEDATGSDEVFLSWCWPRSSNRPASSAVCGCWRLQVSRLGCFRSRSSGTFGRTVGTASRGSSLAVTRRRHCLLCRPS